MQSLGTQLARMIAAMGIDTVFGIPGVHTVGFYRGLPDSGLRHVTPRHEQGAGFMADGFARASGRAAACFVISGPGVTNIATAMGQAYADSIPMLVISSVLNRAHLGRGEGRLHELKDQSALVAGVAAWSATVSEAGDLAQLFDRARTCFVAERPRPVHVELPLDVIEADAVDFHLAGPPSKPAADTACIDRAADALRHASRPLVVLGGGLAGDAEAAHRVVESVGAPVVATINAKGLLPPGHPLLIGSLLPERPVLDALADADVVLALGTELGETDTLDFGGCPAIGGRLIRVDIEATQLVRNASPWLGIVADAATAARQLAGAIGQASRHDGAARTTALRETALSGLDPAYRMHGRVLTRIAEAFPGIVIAGDSTQPVYGGNLTYDAPAPRTWFNSATGFGTLGYGLPAALGAKLACPDRPVVALTGDGGLQFSIAELATAVELALPVPVLVWNNHGYGEIKRYMRDRQIPEIGVDIHTPDFLLLARGFGATAVRVSDPDALLRCLEDAFVANGPTLIEIDEHDALNW